MKVLEIFGLSFTDDRFYLFPEFLKNKPIERLLGEDLAASDFNDDATGRCLRWLIDLEPKKTCNKPATRVDMEALKKMERSILIGYQYERAARFKVSKIFLPSNRNFKDDVDACFTDALTKNYNNIMENQDSVVA